MDCSYFCIVYILTSGRIAIGSLYQRHPVSKKDGDIPTNVVSDYIINTRLWASTQNLAPSSDTGGDVPDGKPTSEIKFVDTDYEPSKNLQ